MQIEEWKEIETEGYFVSSLGNIRSKNGPFKSSITKKGYHIIRIPHRKYARPLHRVVAELFIGKSTLQVNHKDGNKANNAVTNLEYLTCKENIRHAIESGLRAANINLKSNAMFCRIQLQVIRECFAAGFGNQEISRYFKCNHSTISKIRTGAHYPI